MELFKVMQCDEPDIFTPKIVYDGRKIAFAPRELPLGPNNSRRFSVVLPQANGGGNPTRAPRVYFITLTMVAKINPEVLDGYIHGQQSTDEKVLTALTALNVVIRMEPNLNFPFNKRSFYTPQDTRGLGGGMVAWRGIFQSVRPTIGRLVVNVDLATAVMYKDGPLIPLCIEFMNRPPNTNPAQLLSPGNNVNFSERDRIRLQKFLAGLRIQVTTTGAKPRVIRGLSTVGANAHTFDLHGGGTMTVSQYFGSIGHPLTFPTVICVQVGATAMIPLEMCIVPRGQIFRKQIPDDKMRSVLEFSTMKPEERLEKIKQGIQTLQYGQSDYVKDFGMEIDTEPLKVDEPKSGAWNMYVTITRKRKYLLTIHITIGIVRWAVVIYTDKFSNTFLQDAVKGFLKACESVDPLVRRENGQGDIAMQLKNLGAESVKTMGGLPSLVVAILPDGGGDIYTKVGVGTQCLKASKCSHAKEQYWMNVVLKVNVKLGGINVVLDSSALNDPINPTVILGADVIHPPPGATDRPSFTAVVGSVDTHAAKYVATSRVQTGRQEIINDLKDMCKHVLGLYMIYRQKVENKGEKDLPPKKLIFYRDGVSEGQFKDVLKLELPLIKEACMELKINPKITLIIVGKRHHNQMFPPPNVADRSGNAPPGSVIDTGIAHPTNFDFILQSHAGILGTSRPGHYTVLHDEYGFNADSIQAISFALCHVYARATRSVSIPAPVYYADIVCSRAKNHFDPNGNLGLSDTSTQATGEAGGNLEAFKQAYKPLHANQRTLMYFSLSSLQFLQVNAHDKLTKLILP
ncbi:Piwi domain-containing protein [Gymnopilus junonius]|uniref:Piwi domain-containing protein n=1 Tax=Gymnopilus junonius TaxID=109634 RepID=A0A9P5TLH2_GYMJU|nr:Piwi domain-containing protein [Gymnopilus junonius]